jgi:hypothetical protein
MTARTRPSVVVALVLVSVLAIGAGVVSAISLAQVHELSDQVEGLEAWVGEPPTLTPEQIKAYEDIGIPTTLMGYIANLSKTSLDHGQRLDALELEQPTTSVPLPLGCFAGDFAVWQINGLGCT